MKVIKKIKDDCITGAEYGTIEVPDTVIEDKKSAVHKAYKQIQKARTARIRKNNTKQK